MAYTKHYIILDGNQDIHYIKVFQNNPKKKKKKQYKKPTKSNQIQWNNIID